MIHPVNTDNPIRSLPPEKQLWAAVLDRAYRDITGIPERPLWKFDIRGEKNQHQIRRRMIRDELCELRRWMYTPHAGGLSWICSALDLPEEKVLKIFEKEYAARKKSYAQLCELPNL